MTIPQVSREGSSNGERGDLAVIRSTWWSWKDVEELLRLFCDEDPSMEEARVPHPWQSKRSRQSSSHTSPQPSSWLQTFINGSPNARFIHIFILRLMIAIAVSLLNSPGLILLQTILSTKVRFHGALTCYSLRPQGSLRYNCTAVMMDLWNPTSQLAALVPSLRDC